MRTALVRHIMLLTSLLLLATTGYAQISTGSIIGTVSDKSGAVIPGADVNLTDSATGVARSTSTTGMGAYSLTAVPPGIYSLSIRKQGFRIGEHRGIILTVIQTLTFNEILIVGSTSQSVVVKANTVIREGVALVMEFSTVYWQA